jgi:O-antigen/teichoic acid export membrane protein
VPRRVRNGLWFRVAAIPRIVVPSQRSRRISAKAACSNRFGPALFAVYSIGTAQLPLVYMLQESATSVLIPRVSLLQRSGEHREIVMQMIRAIRKLAAAYLPIYFLLLVAGREFIRFLFTDRYADAWPVFAVNLTLLPISVILFDPLYRAYAEQRYFLIRLRIVLCLAIIPLLWFGTARFGPVGAIAAVVAVLLTERVITIIRFSGILGLSWSDAALAMDVGKLAVAAGAAGLATALVRARILGHKPIFILIVCGVIFGAVYLAGVLVLRIPSPDEKRFALARLMAILPSSLRPLL